MAGQTGLWFLSTLSTGVERQSLEPDKSLHRDLSDENIELVQNSHLASCSMNSIVLIVQN